MRLESVRIQFIYISLSFVYLQHEVQFPRMSSRKILHKTIS